MLVQEWGTHAEDRSALAHQAASGFAHVHATRYLPSLRHTEVLHVEERVQVLRLNEGVFVSIAAASGRPRGFVAAYRDTVKRPRPVDLWLVI